MIRKVYLKLSIQALVIAAAANTFGKTFWFTPLRDALRADFAAGQYHALVLAAVELAGLFICYWVVSALLLWAFDRSWRIRVLVDRLFDVEGVYLESVYINDELEVVGINRIHFIDGELKVDSELRWPKVSSDASVKLTVWARTKSVDELCTTSSVLLQYVFEDTYSTRPDLNKTGLTKLTLHRDRTPSLFNRMFGHPFVTNYTGSFDSFDNAIRGVIHGRRLNGKEAREALASDDMPRERMLVAEVNKVRATGTRLREQPPGIVLPATLNTGG